MKAFLCSIAVIAVMAVIAVFTGNENANYFNFLTGYLAGSVFVALTMRAKVKP